MCPALNVWLLFIFFLIPYSCLALPSDKNKPVHIIADTSIYNYKTGINFFEGHVKVDQGTTHLLADRVITTNNAQHKIQVATAYGLQALAHYWTVPKVGDPEVHARAKVIKFYPIESNITLEQNVVVTQGENSFQGELIHYNSGDETITVPGLEKSRAVLVYHQDE